MNKKLTGKAALVTGGSRGIGDEGGFSSEFLVHDFLLDSRSEERRVGKAKQV